MDSYIELARIYDPAIAYLLSDFRNYAIYRAFVQDRDDYR